MTLLKKAAKIAAGKKTYQRSLGSHEQMVEVALAFAKGELTSGQIRVALETTSNVHTLLASHLMTAVRNGELLVSRPRPRRAK